MKLPLNETNPTEDPSEPVVPEDGNSAGGQDIVADHPATNGTNADPDFSEYLWMEHEDDFDREVLKELHEEETMHYYCDLFEEAQANGPLRGSHRLIALNPPPEPILQIRNGVDALGERFTRVITFSRPLNPDAPEFVPRCFTNPLEENPTDETTESKDPSVDTDPSA